MFDHGGDDSRKQRTANFKAGIGIDFYEPWPKLAINHEIQPKYLKVIDSPLPIQIQIVSFDNISSNIFHFSQDLFSKVDLPFGKTTI